MTTPKSATTVITIPPKEKVDIAKVVSAMKAKADMKITTPEDYETAGIILKTIAEKSKVIEAKRVAIVKPFNDGVKAVNDMFKTMSAPLVEADKTLRATMSEYVKAEREREIKVLQIATEKIEKARANEEAKVDQNDALSVAKFENKMQQKTASVMGAVTLATTKTGVTTTAVTWQWEVEDFKELPDEYKEVDGKALNQAKKNLGENGEPKPIKGVKWTKEESVRLK